MYHHPHKNVHFANHILPKLSAYKRWTRVAQMATQYTFHPAAPVFDSHDAYKYFFFGLKVVNYLSLYTFLGMRNDAVIGMCIKVVSKTIKMFLTRRLQLSLWEWTGRAQ
jgi:hypothetical protein